MGDKIYGILGRDLKSNYLPEFYKHLGISDLNSFEVEQDKLASFIKAREFDRLVVTAPYMRTVMPLLSKTSEEARRVGAVNAVIKNENGETERINTGEISIRFA